MTPADRVAAGCGALLSLMILSRAWGDNRGARFAESLFVGVSAAYVVAVAAWSTLVVNLAGRIHPPLLATILPGTAPAPADRTFLVPLGLGVLLLAPRGSRHAGLAAWTGAFVAGFTAGSAVVAHVSADLIEPIRASWVPLVAVTEGGRFAPGQTLSRLALLLGTLAGYAALSPRAARRGVPRLAARIGRGIILVALGAAFGGLLVSRAAQLAGRLDDLARVAARLF